MATIEPRLIHLLNESTSTPKPGHAELPPIKGYILPQSSSSSSLVHDHSSEQNGLQPPRHAPYSATDDGHPGMPTRPEGTTNHSAERPLVSHISSQDLRMILDHTPDAVADDVANKKRPNKEDFVQLPQPLKKQKAAAQQQHAFPPIIVGLLEPPEHAALLSLPPISFDGRPQSEAHTEASTSTGNASFTENHYSKTSEEQHGLSPPRDSENTVAGKPKRKAAKPRRKWSEEETNHLLLGVSKHGVGRWTDIMDDPEYSFHCRSAGDLKDRFRTCCPAELRNDLLAQKPEGTSRNIASGKMMPVRKPKKGLMAENILNQDEEQADADSPTHNDSDPAGPKQRKSRAHRKKLEDLVELGIKGPFKKSHRRERRPFSEQDDREILEGFELFGPQWTKIQRDSRFHLSSRQPTDLRDRLRNKYPERFQASEKTTLHVKGDQSCQANNTLEPSVNMAIGNSLNASRSAHRKPQLDRVHSKDEVPRWSAQGSFTDSTDYLPSSTHGIWTDQAGAGFPLGAIGEMDISRLLLDDSHSIVDPSVGERRGMH
ncbi:telomeric repeat-binding factor 2 [Microdochium nivale]|nr:telomeric repeat-binding factor 2 [Microdochium nivale]